MNPILFYKIYDRQNNNYFPYYEFCNFSKFPFTVDKILYKTSEHYYQSKKAIHKEDELKIINCETAREAADLGRTIECKSNWEDIKTNVMYDALYYKFTNYPNLIAILINTGEREIIEDSPTDYFWGWGKEHTGKNMLGKLLMILRKEFKNKNKEENIK
jgi:N-glycosidase YbiA